MLDGLVLGRAVLEMQPPPRGEICVMLRAAVHISDMYHIYDQLYNYILICL